MLARSGTVTQVPYNIAMLLFLTAMLMLNIRPGRDVLYVMA
jgi:hypothetical protein